MQHRHKIVGSLLFAALWVGVALWRPTSTFHLAPLIVAAWPAIGERRMERVVPMALVGFAIAAATTGLLAVGGLLEGPSLLPWGGAGLESIVAAVIGSMTGIAYSISAAHTGDSR